MGNFAKAAALVCVIGAPVWAQDTCPGTDIILDMAQTILSSRGLLNQFEKGRIGAEAAYLALYYGGPTDASLAAIDALAAEPRYGEAIDLAAAIRGIDGLAMLDPDPATAIARAGPSLQRAVILADRGETYARLIALALASDNPEAAYLNTSGFTLPVYLLADQDDQMRLDVAAASLRHGLPVIAAYLLADRLDLMAYFDLLRAFPDDPEVQALADPLVIMLSGATLRAGQMVPYADPPADPDIAEIRRNSFDIFRALWLGTPSDFISIMLNQTGRDRDIVAVTRVVLDHAADGRLDPVADPDLVWLLEYQALADQMGRDTVHATLGFFDFPSPNIRHFSGTALQSLDIILARETFGPYLRGEQSALPDRPGLLADDFDWDRWVRLAQAVAAQGGDASFSDPADFAVAAELLAARGLWRQAAVSVDPVARLMDRLVLMRDMMLRVDRLCNAALVQPGQAMKQPGVYLWKF